MTFLFLVFSLKCVNRVVIMELVHFLFLLQNVGKMKRALDACIMFIFSCIDSQLFPHFFFSGFRFLFTYNGRCFYYFFFQNLIFFLLFWSAVDFLTFPPTKVTAAKIVSIIYRRKKNIISVSNHFKN